MSVPLIQALDRFAQGGSVEIRYERTKVVYAGVLTSIAVERKLVLTLAWCKKSTTPPRHWVKEDEIEYQIPLGKYFIFSIDPGLLGQNRICLYFPKDELVLIFYPRDTSHLEEYKQPQFMRE